MRLIIEAVARVFHYIQTRKKAKTMELNSKSMGFSFQRKASLDPHIQSLNFRLFSLGDSRLQNFIHGKRRFIDVKIFDYQYIQYSDSFRFGERYTDNKHPQTVALFESKSIHFPKFDLRPEKALHQWGSMLKYKDIDLHIHSGFTGLYSPSETDETIIRDVFTDKIVDSFLENTDYM